MGSGAGVSEGGVETRGVWEAHPDTKKLLDSVTFTLRGKKLPVLPSPRVMELDPKTGAEWFRSRLAEAKASYGAEGATVEVKDADDYRKMRLFTTEDGTAGFALNGEDIVSVFRHLDSPHAGATPMLVTLAIQHGGRTLDCFDTKLVRIYRQAGMREAKRMLFNDDYAPDDWDYGVFDKYVGSDGRRGRPDRVFMALDPERPLGSVSKAPLTDDYDAAVAAQQSPTERYHTRREGQGGTVDEWIAELEQGLDRSIQLRQVRARRMRGEYKPEAGTMAIGRPGDVHGAGRVAAAIGWKAADLKNTNNHSVVVRVDSGQSSLLLPGDAELRAIRHLCDRYKGTKVLDADVLQVSHHGSDNAPDKHHREEALAAADRLFKAVTPTIAVIPVGQWDYGKEPPRGFTTNAYGHPRKAIVDLLTKRIRGRRSTPIAAMVALEARSYVPTTVSRKIYATAWDGNVVIRATPGGHLTPAIRQ